jgi:plasmid stabilization system protein ParE
VNYTLHRGAEADLLEAVRFYRREGGAKLANRFLDEFERIASLLIEYPGLGTPADDARRVHPLRDFPYSVIYRETGPGSVRVLVVRSSIGIQATANPGVEGCERLGDA